MDTQPLSFSIIIPTHNRADTVRSTIKALGSLAYPLDKIEVVLVDDGSNDRTPDLALESYPYPFRYLFAARSGATQARNAGAKASTNDVLLFLDDDMELASWALDAMARPFAGGSKTVVLGAFDTALPPNPGHFALAYARIMQMAGGQDPSTFSPVSFSECKLGILAVQRTHFFDLGMFQDPTGAWPNWDDVDFGYRAHLDGFQLLRTNGVVGRHHDWAAIELAAHTRRIERASRAAAKLIRRYPELLDYLPMLQDKAPMMIGRDSPTQLLHKGFHSLMATKPMLAGLEGCTQLLERFTPNPEQLWPLYRWIISSYIYRGYRQGLRELAGLGDSAHL